MDDPDSSSAALILALNELDGFSTIAPWRMSFTGPVNPDSLVAGETVRVFKMTTEGEGYPERVTPLAVERELLAEEEFRLSYREPSHELLIIPTQPLDTGATYTAVIKQGVTDKNGGLVASPLQWSIARGTSLLDQCDKPGRSDAALLQCTTHPYISPIADQGGFGLTREEMILAWGVSTQKSDRTFQAAADSVRGDHFNRPSRTETCKAAICLLDVGSLVGQEAPTAPGDKAIVWPGTMTLPSLIETPDDVDIWGETPSQDDVILSTQWQCDAGGCNTDAAQGIESGTGAQTPRLRSWETVPVVLAAPDPDAPGVPAPPEEGYPLVIFQHAIQQDRSNALAIASALAEQGLAVIALDMPLHGLVRNQLDPDDPRLALHAAELNDQLFNSPASVARGIIPLVAERTHYLDLLDANGESRPDGEIDGSGAHFLNPSQPLTQRDVIRQGALDLVLLAHHLREGDLEQCGLSLVVLKSCNSRGFDIDLFEHVDFSNQLVMSHSVGALVVSPFLAVDNNIRSAALLTPLAGIMETLGQSPTIGPRLNEGLAEAGVFPGTENYFRFFAIVQAAIDSIDPLNHAEEMKTYKNEAGESQLRPIYLSQIVGNNSANPSPADLVLPPVAGPDAPLAGSTPLARELGLDFVADDNIVDGAVRPAMATDGTTPDVLQLAVPFLFGAHSSPLLPDTQVEDPRTASPDDVVTLPNGVDVHLEKQQQAARFLADPTQLPVDTSLIQTSAP